MREIKFRAWDKSANKMGNVIAGNWHESAVGNNQRRWLVKFQDEDTSELRMDETGIMQYTGLHDKNGKDIYEDDIVREYPDGIGYWTRVVKYDGHGFILSRIATFLQHEVNWEKQVEVIGNIYENPELLEDK